MKKVGILNFQYSTHNYGAVLQAAALEYICRQLGHKAAHLDYMAKPRVTFIRQLSQLKNRVARMLRILGLRDTPMANQAANEEAFERFRKTFINRTERIKSVQDFRRIVQGFDAAIVGSDQVWRPAMAKDVIAFFLGYVPKGVDRISYAASFGTETWEHGDDAILTEKVRQELQQFKAISCREQSGVEICRNVFGIEAIHVLDPLLLVDNSFFDWVLSHSSVKPGAKLVYYKLDTAPAFHKDLKTISSEFGDALNIYSLSNTVRHYREVPDWLALIAGSEVVVTDSFHCICLGLRFGKEVIYCPNERTGRTRLDSLFKQLDIENEPLGIKVETSMFNLRRSDNIASLLEEKSYCSLDFIKNALSG